MACSSNESTLIDDGAAGRQVFDVGPQGGRVHRDEHVRSVAGREDLVVGDVDLEGGDAGEGARRRPDLGRIVGKRRQVVPEQRALVGETVAGDLHPVAGVPSETDHHLVNRLDPARFAFGLGLRRHRSSTRLACLLADKLRCPLHLCLPCGYRHCTGETFAFR